MCVIRRGERMCPELVEGTYLFDSPTPSFEIVAPSSPVSRPSQENNTGSRAGKLGDRGVGGWG
jgi:hypothetical protein